MIMGYVEVRRSAAEQAALVIYGGMATLYGSGRSDVVAALLEGLTPALREQVVELVDREVVDGLDELVRTHRGQVVEPEAVELATQHTPLTWDERVTAALAVVLARPAPEFDATDAAALEGFGALVGRVRERCLAEDVEPVIVLRRLGAELLSGVSWASAPPMVYLAAKVRDWDGRDRS
jgi:hypothetical protein